MKRVLYSLIVALTLGVVSLGVSCKKDAVQELIVPSESILVGMPGEKGTTSFASHNITSISAISEPKGWEVVNIDMYAKTITVKAPESFDNEEVESGTLTIKGYTPTGSTKSVEIYVAIVPNVVDYTDAPANCYIANKPATRYKFNPLIGGNDIALATDHIALIWESGVGVVKYIDMRDGVASFYLQPVLDENDEPTNEVVAGNALIGAYDARNNLIWSWHIWVTNSNPMEDTISLGGHALMNINLGADRNSEGSTDIDDISAAYGMYYQWGRRTPIVGPHSWNFALNEDKIMYNAKGYNLKLTYEESTSKTGNVDWANDNPTTIIIGNKDNSYDWLYRGHDDALWSTTSKSEHDPCPAGWRIPDSSVYANLTIYSNDDNMNWEEAQKMYGWHLVDVNDNSKRFFFTAQGRRNYLDGRLDNMNVNDELPVPWSGYYWTATTDGDNAKALYFNLNTNTRTWNGIETDRSMQRANALPVRCVKE